MITINSMDYLDYIVNITSYVTPDTTTNGSYSSSEGSMAPEHQSTYPQSINTSTVENSANSEESFDSSSFISYSTTNNLETTSLSTFNVDVSTISDLPPSTTNMFPTFYSSPSNDFNTELETLYPQTEVSSRTTAFEAATISATTLFFTNGTINTSTTPITSSSFSSESNLSTTQERSSSSTSELATTFDSTNKTKLSTKLSSTSQTTQNTAFQETTGYTTNSSTAELPSTSDPFDGKGLSAALGTLAAILVLAVIGILLALWWRSRNQKLRRTLLKLRSISQQSRTPTEDPPDICLDVGSFALFQVFNEIDNKQGKPDVASHVFRRMLSAHEDALNFSKEDARDIPVSMVHLDRQCVSSNFCSQNQDRRRIQSTNDLSTCQSSFSEGDLVKNIKILDSSSAV